MKLITIIKPSDINPSSTNFDYSTFKVRIAARAVIFDGNKVAIIHVSEHDYYMLPGGGVESKNIVEDLKREILEEIGCDIEVTGEVGKTEVYFDRWQKKQTDYCYTARKLADASGTNTTDFEKLESHKVIWSENINQAIEIMSKADPKNNDGKLVRARDLKFLEDVKLTTQGT